MIFCKITTSKPLCLPTQQQEFFKGNIAQHFIYTTQLATNQPPPLVIAIFFAHWQTKVNKVSTDQVHPSHETAFIFSVSKSERALGSRMDERVLISARASITAHSTDGSSPCCGPNGHLLIAVVERKSKSPQDWAGTAGLGGRWAVPSKGGADCRGMPRMLEVKTHVDIYVDAVCRGGVTSLSQWLCATKHTLSQMEKEKTVMKSGCVAVARDLEGFFVWLKKRAKNTPS